MKELIFSIKDIFNAETQTGCLFQYESDFFHIPAYQRGYKWSSDKNGAVTKLLADIHNASQEDKDHREYFLQYITVKRATNKEKYLEVIDGQQRLTTLSILLAVLSLKLEMLNTASGKLDYAIRDNFFSNYLEQKDKLFLLLEDDWGSFKTKEEMDKQDIFYIFSAVKKCNSFLKSINVDIQRFNTYLLNNVKIIVNSVEPHIESETVFKNLNSNKVSLTDAELVKGLLITKAGREFSANFKEVVEIRSNIGKSWDEIDTWTANPKINSFYFNNALDSVEQLLILTAINIGDKGAFKKVKSDKRDFPLFNFFLEQSNYTEIFKELKRIKNTLENWYNDTEIYNLIGFCRFAKNSNHNSIDFLNELLQIKTKSETISFLTEKKNQLLQNRRLRELNYNDTPSEIHQILLALSVFIEGQNNIRFDFYEFEKEKWSLEHIFPQTPEGKNNILNENQKNAIKDILGSHCTSEVKGVLNLSERNDDQKRIYYKALQEHPALNSIGNMCLLSTGANTSNGNKFFDEKRINILKLIQRGNFVPKHTFDVFSKMIKDSQTQQMDVWTEQDIKAHENHIIQSLALKEINESIIVNDL